LGTILRFDIIVHMRLLLVSVSLIGLYFFCESQTKGFRLAEILSDLPNRPEWETPAKPLEALHQPFYYLGSGDQSDAFVSADGATVLKFFKHGTPFKKRSLDLVFSSCKQAFDALREETALLYIHLNKTKNVHGAVLLFDPLHIPHTVDLDATEFVVQKKCTLAFSALRAQLKRRDQEALKSSISALLRCIASYQRKGFSITTPAIRRDFGLLDGRAVAMDIGSFIQEESPTELRRVGLRLRRWLNKHSPDLVAFYDEEEAALLPLFQKCEPGQGQSPNERDESHHLHKGLIGHCRLDDELRHIQAKHPLHDHGPS
jgi:hypothetical protein